jgi:hypothetical protein
MTLKRAFPIARGWYPLLFLQPCHILLTCAVKRQPWWRVCSDTAIQPYQSCYIVKFGIVPLFPAWGKFRCQSGLTEWFGRSCCIGSWCTPNWCHGAIPVINFTASVDLERATFNTTQFVQFVRLILRGRSRLIFNNADCIQNLHNSQSSNVSLLDHSGNRTSWSN